MKILRGDKDNVDFDAPIHLTNDQITKFENFMKQLFDKDVVKIEYVDDIQRGRIGEKGFQRAWELEEFALLIGLDSNERLVEKLGRTYMSINIKRGMILPEFNTWLAENGYELKENYGELAKKYLEEKKAQQLVKRQKQKQISQVAAKIDKILNDSKEPCMIGDKVFYGGECKDGFHHGCLHCPRSHKLIKNMEDVELFNKIYLEEFVD